MSKILYGLPMPTVGAVTALALGASAGTAAMVGGGVLVGGATLASGMMSANAAGDAADAQAMASLGLKRDLKKASGEVEGSANAYIKELNNLSDNFNLYDFGPAFESLYDSIIAPMDVDYRENVLPAITAAYSGLGGGLQSGAYRETIAKTKQQAAETKSVLRAAEREKAMARNTDEYNRKVGVISGVLSADTMAPLMRAQQAPIVYDATTNSIAATLAADQARANILPNTINSALQGAYGGMKISQGLQGPPQQSITYDPNGAYGGGGR